jgi:ankyrin repeat protein/catechol 2,3-dioxygenase-like lactoylglutathione lyase family enzyme
MSESKLPEHPSLDYLKKLAKERLRELRQASPEAKLSAAQLAVARGHGFSSWRALKAEVDRRRAPATDRFFAACRAGDVATLRTLLEKEPGLVRERDGEGSTGLHLAVPHVEAVRLLLEHGADPNVRDDGDNAFPLHFAAGGGYLESTRALLDAGADVHGVGDLHQAGVIGWAAGGGWKVHHDVVALLVERGARHSIFSAIAVGDRELVRTLVEEDPASLSRHRSRFEQGQTPLHFAFAAPDGLVAKAPDYEMADLLIELGADVEAVDDKGRTPLEVAMLRGDREAMRRLKAAGAQEPKHVRPSNLEGGMAALGDSIREPAVPMLRVKDMTASVAWYTSLGFKLQVRYPEDGEMTWARMTFGKSEITLAPGGGEVSLWFYTDRIDDLYQSFKARQLRAAQAALAAGGSEPHEPGIRFEEDLYEPFYGGRQFSVRDLDGVVLVFLSD